LECFVLESTDFSGSGIGPLSSFPPPPPPAPAQLLYELRPLSLGEILDRTFTLYRKRFWLFAGLAVVSASVVTVGSFVQMTWGPAGTKPTAADAPRAAIITGLSSLLIGLIQIVAFSVTQAATVSAVSAVYLGEETTIGKAFRTVRAKWFRYILIVLWQSWSAMWLPLVLLIVGLVLLAMVRLGLRPLGVLVLVLAGFSLIYSVIAYMRNSLAVVASVVEHLKVRRSMRRSKDLAHGRLWRILGLILLMYVLSLVAGVAQATIGFFMGLSHGPQRAMLEALALLTTFVSNSLVTPVGAIAFCLLYIDARVRDEGFDVETLMNRAAGSPKPSPAELPPSDLPSPFSSELV
jgi:hypothetical protein